VGEERGGETGQVRLKKEDGERKKPYSSLSADAQSGRDGVGCVRVCAPLQAEQRWFGLPVKKEVEVGRPRARFSPSIHPSHPLFKR
jgi:hypothetical protein